MSIFGSIAGAIFGGMISHHNAKSQAEHNADLSRENWEYQQKNAHQFEVEDLKAAGLNPILSATNSHMAGMSPVQGYDAGNFGTNITNAMSGYFEREAKKEMQAKDLEIENKKLDNDLKRIAIEERSTSASIEKMKAEGLYYGVLSDYTSGKNVRESNESFARIQQISQDISNSIRLTDAQVNRLNAGSALDYATISKVKADVKKSLASADLASSQKKLIDQGIDDAIAEYNKLSVKEKLSVLKSNGGSFGNWLGNNLRNTFGGIVGVSVGFK